MQKLYSSMRFGRQFIDNLRARVPISSVISPYVNLKHKSKGDFLGLCPFHNEKSPSFNVSDNKGFYHCFGCGAHGDIITFIMEHKGLPYVEAVKELAQQAGIPLPKQDDFSAAREKKIEDSYEVLEMAAKWFEDNLNSSTGLQARLYLKERGLSDETIKKFRLGYAPDEWESLKNYIKNNKVDEDIILANGLITTNEDGSKKYDRFRGRVMFPIFNNTGKVIAFGGRIMKKDEKAAKYINSPETDLFQKSYSLYGFNFAKDRAYKEQKIIAVEGYMDVIALHQAGFNYAVAPLGTALTETHIKQLWKITKEPILCLDGDDAGMRAAKKFAEEYVALLEPGYTIKFAYIPKGQDPDEYIQQNGANAFEKLLQNSKVLSDNLWDINIQNAKLATPEQKADFAKKMMDLVDKIQNPSVKDFYKKDYNNRIYTLSVSNRGKSPFKKATVSQEVKESSLELTNKIERLKERLILLISCNPKLLLNASIEDIIISLEIENKTVEMLAENAIDFCAKFNEKDIDFSGFVEYLKNHSRQDLINYLELANKKDFFWKDNSEKKSAYYWQYLLAEFNLSAADIEIKKYESSDNNLDFNLNEELYERQKILQSEIFNLTKLRDLKRSEYEEILSE
jgi:DNA primase catalytic core